MLPVYLTSFVGRAQEDAEIRRLLQSVRLLTLTGPGGVGKTRLALEAVSQVGTESDTNVAFVDFAPIRDPKLLPQTTAFAVGVREHALQPIAENIIDALRGRSFLLVFDNCEHLIGACAELAVTLLRACPRLKILATSREPLDVDGEIVLRVSPLSEQDAAALFIERARAARFDFTPDGPEIERIAELCRRLDRLPLAIELAAARVRALSIQEICGRLNERFRLLGHARRGSSSRQQTLRATLDWSYGLLSDDERLLFERLAVFAGGCTLSSVEAVCAGDGVQSIDVLELSASLVDKSLVQAEHLGNRVVRYRLMESVREYAWEHLRESPHPEAIRDKHAAFYVSLAKRETHPPLKAADPAFTPLEADYDNVRSALRWLIDCGQVHVAERLAVALGPFWFFQGYFGEGRVWLAELLALPNESEGASPRAPLLFRAGQLAWCQGDFESAQQFLDESIGQFERACDWVQLAQARAVRGHLSRSRGDYAKANATYQQALAESEAVSNIRAQANALLGLCQTAYEQVDDIGARAWARRALTLARKHGLNSIAIAVLQLLGAIEERENHLSAAYDLLTESVALARSLGSHGQWWVVMGLPGLARVLSRQNDWAQASASAVEAVVLARDLGDRQAMARAFEACACVAAAVGQHERAFRLAGAGAALRHSIGAPLGKAESALLDSALETSRRAFGRRRAGVSWSAGLAMTVERAFDEATSPEYRPPSPAVAGRASGKLTARECEVVVLVSHGLTNRQISERLIITEATVIRHVSNVLAKLGMASRAQIAVWAVQHAVTSRAAM